jgi:hypothetical protein
MSEFWLAWGGEGCWLSLATEVEGSRDGNVADSDGYRTICPEGSVW